MNEAFNFEELLKSTKKALLGEVISTFRGVAVDWKNNKIYLYFYIDGPISDEMHFDCSCIATEVLADFFGVGIEEEIIRLDCPLTLPIHTHWIYKRKECQIKNKSINEDDNPTEYKDIKLKALKCMLELISPTIRGIYLNSEQDKNEFYFYIRHNVIAPS